MNNFATHILAFLAGAGLVAWLWSTTQEEQSRVPVPEVEQGAATQRRLDQVLRSIGGPEILRESMAKLQWCYRNFRSLDTCGIMTIQQYVIDDEVMKILEQLVSEERR